MFVVSGLANGSLPLPARQSLNFSNAQTVLALPLNVSCPGVKPTATVPLHTINESKPELDV